ncbi:MAG: hypothetical protein JOZ38_11735 [Candidatus Eremiobacteraeota bacterium]|nr:hypothetical protein [Candidatus Eremiobacteraeota bacterium]
MHDSRMALMDALKVAKASARGLPTQVQEQVRQIAEVQDENERHRLAAEVSRWIFSQHGVPGIDKFTLIAYNALRDALEPYMIGDI